MSEKEKKSVEINSKINTAFYENINALTSFLRRFFSNKQDIEDVLQETYIKAVEAESRTTIRNPRAFLFRVSRNLALNENARAFNRLSDALEDSKLSSVSDNMPGLDEQIDQKSRFEHFCRAVRSLSPKCQKVFVLRKVYGLTNSEIANYLGISTSTVEKHIAKGLTQCKVYMDNQSSEFLDSESRKTL